ncbi:YqiA/YcfP family alpha/beta fold hydrolase [Xylophilus sp. ASV27]|uniref:YqiA/YcfP family alpha/beta fold hydrolase n=1 Tax=Xylophilus sp. ASV27 TaxID=2795129 RepID=UPI0018EBD6E3|nr:YqiA/YcfP family alpha/beta fold hydrolase [Xylophilus sp. ASV27]
MPTTHLLYLHGFRSSPQSAKARLMAARVALRHPRVHWWCPQLPPSPRAAMERVAAQVATWPAASMAVVGSSLGGFYASWVQARTGCAKAVLLNPAVNPARDLARYIGEQTAWHAPQERFYFAPEFVDELRALRVPPLDDPARQFALLTQGDEVLDWREMAARYAGATLTVLPGGDHAISDFERHLDAVCGFLELA